MYAACALTGAPQSVVDTRNCLVRDLLLLKVDGVPCFELLDFEGLEGEATPLEVFEFDQAQVQKADVILALGDMPSTGTGIELMIAANNGTPILYVETINKKTSRMVKGFCEASPIRDSVNIHFIDESQQAKLVAEHLSRVIAAKITGNLQSRSAEVDEQISFLRGVMSFLEQHQEIS